MKKHFAFALTLLSVGCAANPYQKFYTPSTPPPAVLPHPPTMTPPQLLRGNEGHPLEDVVTMQENGYSIIGYSSFSGRAVDVKQAAEFGKTLGATAVVVYGRYANTVSGSIPLLLPNPPTTSTTAVQGNVTGTGGSATYSGTGVTTTTGGYTTHQVPYSVDRYDQFAGYFAPSVTSAFGAFVKDLTPDQRARLQRNRGVVVMAVVKRSPAFRADFLRGDVILEFGGQPVEDSGQFLSLVNKLAGQKVIAKVIRGDTAKQIEVQLDQPGA